MMRKRKVKLLSAKMFGDGSMLCEFLASVRGYCLDTFILQCMDHNILYNRCFFPGCLFTDKKEALISMVVEAYTNGVSTRKIKHLSENM